MTPFNNFIIHYSLFTVMVRDYTVAFPSQAQMERFVKRFYEFKQEKLHPALRVTFEVSEFQLNVFAYFNFDDFIGPRLQAYSFYSDYCSLTDSVDNMRIIDAEIPDEVFDATMDALFERAEQDLEVIPELRKPANGSES